MEADATSKELTRSFLSYRLLKEVLETSNIKDDEEVRASDLDRITGRGLTSR